MKIELTDQHARILIAALDLYSRVNMGQLWALAEAIQSAKTAGGAPLPDEWQIREQWTDTMTRGLFGYPSNASHGICSPDVSEAAQVAYDMQCVIRRDIAIRENHTGVWRDEPMHVAKDVPLITVTQSPAL